MKIICRKVGRSLVPVDDEGFDALAKVKDGRDVKVEFTMSRNLRHHRLAFAIFRFVKMHCEPMANTSIDQIKTAVKLAAGYVDTFVDCQTGESCYVPKSIAWESCDQLEFNQFFDAAVNVIVNRWMAPGSTSEEVRREIILMCDGPHAVGRMAS